MCVFVKVSLCCILNLLISLDHFFLDIGIKEEPVSDHEEDMRVIDDVDEEAHSDHGSHISNASSFSHTFSRSPSFTGSFTGSFSGTLSLSSFTASNTSLGNV